MHKISEITKRDILDLFKYGIDVDYVYNVVHEKYLYYGRLSEIDFLKRLYNLETMESLDSRHHNAERDIIQHTVNNDDYEDCWVFTDERFHLEKGTDQEYLKFLCEVFHPAVKVNGRICDALFSRIQQLIRRDGYELYECKVISGQPIYSYRELSDKEIGSQRFVPFSVRKDKQVYVPKIPKKIRYRISELVEQYSANEQFTDEQNCNCWAETKDETFFYIQKFYTPKAYNEAGEYVGAKSINHLILKGSPKHVFDVIEVFYCISHSKEFETEINQELSKIEIKLVDGKLEKLHPSVDVQLPKEDDSLKGLISQADVMYSKCDHASLQLAVEKMWDALERVKTVFTSVDKAKSSQKVIEAIAGSATSWKQHFNNEFVELTKIGNDYQIRHFETNKEPIDNDELLMYLYIRCSALVSLAVKSVERTKNLY